MPPGLRGFPENWGRGCSTCWIRPRVDWTTEFSALPAVRRYLRLDSLVENPYSPPALPEGTSDSELGWVLFERRPSRSAVLIPAVMAGVALLFGTLFLLFAWE